MRTISTSYGYVSSTSLPPTASSTTAQRSPWHSPVPYLFGGLAAMLGLIAFALLILACSYWKLSGYLQNEQAGDRDLEIGVAEKQGDSAKMESMKVYEEKILVIMAGDEKPTFLAAPVYSKSSCFGDGIGKAGVENNENCEESEKGMGTHVQDTTPAQNEDTQQHN